MNRLNRFLYIIALAVVMLVGIPEASGQEREYYEAQVCMIYADGDVRTDVWEMNYGFDNLNDIVYFNLRPNENEEFTLIHKIYNIADSFDRKGRLVESEYYLDDLAMLYIKPAYDNPENPMEASGYRVKLVETLPYSMRRNDLKSIEFDFFIYF